MASGHGRQSSIIGALIVENNENRLEKLYNESLRSATKDDLKKKSKSIKAGALAFESGLDLSAIDIDTEEYSKRFFEVGYNVAKRKQQAKEMEQKNKGGRNR